MNFLCPVLIVISFAQPSYAIKKKVLPPFQKNIQDCIDKKIDVKNIDSSKKLYEAIGQFYILVTSETLYREVEYTQKDENKKLRYENGLIQIYKINDEDGKADLISSEKFGEKKDDYQMRHKIRSVESRMNQLLFQANISSDYQKIKETRSGQVVLEIVWVDKHIKSLRVEFLDFNKTLTCAQKEQTDICSCRD